MPFDETGHWVPDPAVWRLDVPRSYALRSPNRAVHWGTIRRERAKAKRDTCLLAKDLLHRRGCSFSVKVSLTITLVHSSRTARPLDPDNALASVKGYIDGLVAAGLIANDTPAHVQFEPIRQEWGGRPTVVIEIREAE